MEVKFLCILLMNLIKFLKIFKKEYKISDNKNYQKPLHHHFLIRMIKAQIKMKLIEISIVKEKLKIILNLRKNKRI